MRSMLVGGGWGMLVILCAHRTAAPANSAMASATKRFRPVNI
jgi:hypothetical protein